MRDSSLIDAPAAPSAILGAYRCVRSRTVFGVQALAASFLALAGFVSVLGSPADYDLWWHLAAGRYISAERVLPVPDPFSFTAGGRTWVAHEWLAELVMYRLHLAFGDIGPFVLYAASMAAVVLLTLSTLRRTGTRLLPAAAWTAVLLGALYAYAGPRPQVAAFALMAAVIWLLERWVARPDRSIWALPAVFALWGNVHGSFAVGMAAPALLLIGDIAAARLGLHGSVRLCQRDRMRLAVALGASVLALLCNPNGPALLLYPVTKLGNPMLKYLGEWHATDISDARSWPFVVLATGYVSLVLLRRPRVPFSDGLVAAAFMLSAFWSLRFVPFAALYLVVLIGRALALPAGSELPVPRALARLIAWREERSRRMAHPTPLQQVLNVAVAVIVAAVVLRSVKPYEAAGDTRLPVAAVDRLGAEGLPGPLFHDYNWGGYLIWRLWPQTHVFIDGRGDDLYTSGGELRRYFEVSYLDASADQVLDQYAIRTILYRRDTPLTRYLLAGGQWAATYDDGRVVRLERKRPHP